MFLREAREISISKAWQHLHAKYKYETGKGTLWNYVMFFYARRVKESGYMCKIVEDMLIFKINFAVWSEVERKESIRNIVFPYNNWVIMYKSL